ncbi:rhodanese-like domain-containing protein [Winogradskyella aurantiaca]|uniref:rhodanese-like domain-containing protein n=1 Tax=Winogradskyella aurantiaca TaxID=2219558 RepID=UPI000E1D1291|nr:rhodanese-like domain-containing protein [Winogradskyella aurantiaca]
MKKLFGPIIILLMSLCTQAQPMIGDVLANYNTGKVPYMYISEIDSLKTHTIFLDAREPVEYEVSHIDGAIHVGFNSFNLNIVSSRIPNKKQTIIVYCSIGVRSEIIGERLKSAGYTNVFNLYGGIFEWVNQGFPIYKSQEQLTDSVHAYSPRWEKWLTRGIKVYD